MYIDCHILMKHFITLAVALFCFFVPLNSVKLYAQQYMATAMNALTTGPRNYTTFTTPNTDNRTEAIANNPGYEQHPEVGMLFPGTPCDNCYELIGSRTETSKTFVKTGANGKDVYRQTSTAPMHYHDAQGNWRTIKTQLTADASAQGIFTAAEQETPVFISPLLKMAALGKTEQSFQFDHNLELVYAKPDGTQQFIGAADYSHYTAGDDGVYITNAWPGIDIEMFTLRGAVKTNFWINKPMPEYAGGQLLVRDHIQLSDGLSLYSQGQTKYTGNLEIKNGKGERVYAISAATAFEKRDAKHTLQMLEYYINGNTLDIALPGNFLNRPASAYPVIIDPLVSIATTSTVNGSTYSSGWTTGCTYTNPATVPAKVTVTDVQFTFQYVTSGGALLSNGAFDFKLGTCRSPSPTTLYWNCNSLLTGTCTGTDASIFPSITSCMPAPQCTAYNLNLTMDFYQNYLSDPPCSNLYITAGSPLTITVIGHTIETSAITASATTVCAGGTTTLTATSNYGVPPYTYTWTPGGLTGTTVTENPTATTTYAVTSTDACGDVATASQTINVNSIFPIAGNTTLCAGNTTTLSDAAVGGGTWSSSNPSVATIGATTGVVTALTAGTTTITFTTATGCTETVTVTVKPPVSPISGPTNVCIGGTTILTDPTAGGTWSSSLPLVAGIGAATGMVSGAGYGTTVITYATTGVGCSVTANLTVNFPDPITGVTTVCAGGISTLADASGGGTWSSSNLSVATIGATSGIVTGISGGTSTITFNTAVGCYTTATVTVIVPTPIIGTTTVCQGSTTTLSNSTTGGSWSSGSAAIAAVGAATGVVTGVTGGTAIISYTNPAGCAVTTTVTVNAVAPIAGSAAVCAGSSIILTDGTPGGNWNSSAPATASVSTATGVVSGVTAGSATINYTAPNGCSTAAIITVNVPSPITGGTNVCQGNTLTLSNASVGGTWSSSNNTIASIGSLTGVVTGTGSGIININYTVPGGCNASATLTVNPLAPIAGTLSICEGSTTALSDATASGSWSSGAPAIASIDASTGLVTGAAAGTSPIEYTTPAGCIANTTVTVNLLPSPITGSTLICGSATLGDVSGGGSWTSSAPAIATISFTTGIVTAVTTGTVSITYTMPGGCNATTLINVNPVAPISGTPTVCQGNTTALSYPSTGGVWNSLGAAIATVDAASGLVTGLSAGMVTINYTAASGCVASIVVTVDTALPVSGTPTVCQGSTTALSDGVAGGTWTSGSPAIAPVGATGIVSGASAGIATISYTTSSGCVNTAFVTVNPLAAISGIVALCAGATTTLSDATSGGSWNSATSSVATIDATTGIVNGIAAGTSPVNYTTTEGCTANIIVTVNALPSAITGPSGVCQGNTATLSNTLAGGTWTSVNPALATIGAASGVISGITPGVVTINYTTAAGCAVTTSETINPLSPITGTGAICAGSNTILSDATTSGSWSSSSTTVATIDPSTGLLTGIAGGTSLIGYTTVSGCTANFTETINGLPSAITGTPGVCAGNSVTLSDATTGGTWSSSNATIATAGAATGTITGITAGTVNISYTTPAGCIASTTITVNPLPLAITGTASICAGNTTTLSNTTTGGTWTSSSAPVATIGAATGLMTGVSAGTATASYTTPEGCSATLPVTIDAVPAAITGITVLCAGASSTLSNTLAGGAWSSTGTTVATIGATSGFLSGLSAGTSTISYITPAGCFAVTDVTVNPTPVISGFTSDNPSTCITNDGTITLNGLTPGATFTVNYYFGTTSVTLTSTADGSGQVIITGLAAGSYTNFSVTTTLGCPSNVLAGPVVLSLPAAPPAPVTGSNSPICDGSTLELTATDATTGVTYSWSGPAGFTSALQNPALNPSVLSEAGTYTVTATKLGCVSDPSTTLVVIHPVPTITNISFTDPTTCTGKDGTITLFGLAAGVSYTVTYTFNGAPASASIIANTSGEIVLTGMVAGNYTGFNASSFTCLSNTVGPVTLSDPNPPPAPKLGSNSPVCSGKTLTLTATDAISDLTYEWTGPNGFSSSLQNPEIPNTTMADSGIYTLSIRYENCPATASEVIMVHPPVVLTNVTMSQTIPFGSSIQLYAEGAEFYLWYPDDGSLSNQVINNPVATPQVPTEYIVEGMNIWGCRDSVTVSINVDNNITEFVPAAFTPNNDGKNDVFRIVNMKYDKLVDFTVFNRWGQMIYHNTGDPNKGWDGTFNGVPQDMGTYYYNIILSRPDGTTKTLKGDVTLIR